MSTEANFQAAMAGAGLVPPEAIYADGKIHRFGIGGKSCFYVLHLDGVPAGSFGDWKTGHTETWCAKRNLDLSDAERHAVHERIKAAQRQRDAEKARLQADAASQAAAIWAAAAPSSGDHPYLVRKAIQPYGLRTDGHHLFVPMRDTAGKLHSLQTIDPDGKKRFFPGGRVSGCYSLIGAPVDRIVICEGFATGASVHMATGDAVAVCFSAGNLLPVATALHKAYPALVLLLGADDDHRSQGNPGLSAAKSAALAVGGFVVVPHFPTGRPIKATDFNDLAALAGLDAVRACFSEIVGFLC